MKIAILQSSLWLSGGARVVVEYANRLAARGHQVSIVIPKDSVAPELAAVLSPAVRVCEADLPLVKPSGLIQQFRLALAMIRAVPKVDVIVATHTPTTVVSLVAGKFLRRGLPVWFYMDYPGMFADRRVEGWLLRHAYLWHRSALVLSSHSGAELISFGKIPWFQVGLGISDAEYLRPLPAERMGILDRERKAILYLGDFRPRKGLADFLQAAELLHEKRINVELWIALKEAGEVQTSLPYRLIYRPNAVELADLYATCNLFVSASWYEGFGLPPLEAMACAAPVVTTDSGGVRDFVRDGENCLLVPPRDPQKMAQAILRVFDDPALEENLRKNGPSTASNYGWEQATDRFEQALQKSLTA